MENNFVTNFLVRRKLLSVGLIFIAMLLIFGRAREVSAIGLLSPFGGRIIAISPNLDALCPVGTHIITIGLPKPRVAIFTNTPPLVKNGPARVGKWAIGLTLPGIPPCLPVVRTMGVSK
ncbi:MAG: hypothetical protein AAB617_02195 [Patescibacteria group bacterium]